MNIKPTQVLILAATSLTLVSMFSNCAEFEIPVPNFESKRRLLAKPLFTIPDPVSAQVTQASQDPQSSPQSSQSSATPLSCDNIFGERPPNCPEVPQAPVTLPVQAFCSNNYTKKMKGNVRKAQALTLDFIQNKKTACSVSDPGLKSALLAKKHLRVDDLMAACPNLTPGNYNLQLRSPTSSNLFVKRSGKWKSAALPVTVDTTAGSTGSAVNLTAAAKKQAWYVMFDQNPGEEPKKCNKTASPLLIQFRPPSAGKAAVELTSPERGVMFDILGANHPTVAHTKEQISWLTAETAAANYFLVLPDDTGRVSGIDQMFGDNTHGPDGTFASNGYEALAKWDGRNDDGSFSEHRDGFITAADPVFKKLRLWADSNINGVVEPGELLTLDQAQIMAIDLTPDASFVEFDEHGNQITLKSLVHTKSHQSLVIYDIWFALPSTPFDNESGDLEFEEGLL